MSIEIDVDPDDFSTNSSDAPSFTEINGATGIASFGLPAAWPSPPAS